ncbi:MAG: hypothetical protein Q4G40_10355 [Brachybacterium sp.]|nr:hypothetical protein [Brachybacterium sp.]
MHDQHSDGPSASNQDVVPDERMLQGIEHALRIQTPIAEAYVQRLRAKSPQATPEELVDDVCDRFRKILTVTGAGIGGAAALPGIGTAAAVGLTIGEGVSFAEACAFLTLSVAAIHGVDMKDGPTRRAIMLGVIGGEKGEEIMAKALGKRGIQWGTLLAGSGNTLVTRTVNKQVNRFIRRRILARAGGVWLGRLLPFGIGAVVGGLGNRAIAGSVIEAVRDIFSHAPGTGPTIEGEAA